jgi:hypothetical protein
MTERDDPLHQRLVHNLMASDENRPHNRDAFIYDKNVEMVDGVEQGIHSGMKAGTNSFFDVVKAGADKLKSGLYAFDEAAEVRAAEIGQGLQNLLTGKSFQEPPTVKEIGRPSHESGPHGRYLKELKQKVPEHDG